MAKVIMIQGTMSGVGKSLLTAGLCRVFKRNGYRAAPFKSQNMALNSYITGEGLEIGRAQAMQAEAAGIEPRSCMNPILLKPTGHTGSQVVVNGTVLANMSAQEYFSYRDKLIPEIRKAFQTLAETADIIVIEGAGSPVELNLGKDSFVNMGLAKIVDAPVLLAGDIDRGGVFAQLLGTLMLLEKEDRQRVQGLVVNKFRGDFALFASGTKILEEQGGVPVVGVVPYMDILLEDEDSLAERLERKGQGKIDIAVIRYPRISNFTDFNVFEQHKDVAVRYVSSTAELGCPDILFLPGSKNTIEDLKWMREHGLEAGIKDLAGKIPICGICGGYQMLGCEISDPEGAESGETVVGMELLPVVTRLQRNKVRRRVQGRIGDTEGFLQILSGLSYEGYEIHMGKTSCIGNGMEKHAAYCQEEDGVFVCGEVENVYGTYIHGIFDEKGISAAIVDALAKKKGIVTCSGNMEGYKEFKERQYEKLADNLERHLDMEAVYGMLKEARLEG